MTPDPEAVTAAAVSETPPAAALAPVSGRKAAAYRVLARVAYWSPVFAVLLLFAQVSFLGLRPAMAEARRLSVAEVELHARHARARAENAVVSAQLAARADPIFRERQRRLRLIEPAAVPETSAGTASATAGSPSTDAAVPVD